MTTIHIDIERLVVDGLPLDARQSRQLQSALESELTRLFASTSSALDASAAVDRLRAEPIAWNPAAGPAVLGEQLGQAIHGSVPS